VVTVVNSGDGTEAGTRMVTFKFSLLVREGYEVDIDIVVDLDNIFD